MQPKSNKRAFAIVSVIILLIVARQIYKHAGSSASGGAKAATAAGRKSEDVEVTKRQAYIIARDFVKPHLTAPASATFPDNPGRYEVNRDTFVLAGIVDAENALGGHARSAWVCRMKYQGGDWADQRKWTLIKLIMDGKRIE